MSLNAASFFKGVTTGIVIGTAVTMLGDPISDRQRSRLVKRTEGIFKNMGSLIDSAMDIFR